MAENSGQTDRKTPAEHKPRHPYVKYEGSSLWAAVESAIRDLVANADIVEQTNRNYIVGYLCKVLTDKIHGF
jgi:hypothetical protein